jgi:hypothetical protein
MVLFPAYAMLVWALTWRWRRSWVGLGAVVAGVLGVGLLGIAHKFTAVVFPAQLEGPLFSLLLAVEALCVLVVGLFITTLPRERVDRPCRRCRYELIGLDDENPTCPECGMAHAARRVKLRHCRRCAHALWLGRGDNPGCPGCGIDHCIREMKPEGPGVFAPVLAAAARAVQPLTSRYTMPSARTQKGRPTIMVIRNPDNTFTSIG